MKKTTLDLALSLTTAKPITIKSSRALKEASEELTELNQTLDALTADKEKITKPLNQALKEARLKYKPAEDALTSRIASIRLAMTSYQTALINAQEAKKTALIEQITDGTLSLDEASSALASSKTAPARVETVGGSVSFVPRQVLKVLDLDKVPRTYLVLNESLALADLKAGAVIPGLAIEVIQVPRNSR